jgi:hypothetical protein
MSHFHVRCTHRSIRWINDLSSLYLQIVLSAHHLPPLGRNHPPFRPKFPQRNGLVGGNGSPWLNRVAAVCHPSSLVEKNHPSVPWQCSGEFLFSFFNWHLNLSGANKAVLDQPANNPETGPRWFSLCGGNSKSNVVIFPGGRWATQGETVIVVKQCLSKDEKDLSTDGKDITGNAIGVLTVVAGHLVEYRCGEEGGVLFCRSELTWSQIRCKTAKRGRTEATYCVLWHLRISRVDAGKKKTNNRVTGDTSLQTVNLRVSLF